GLVPRVVQLSLKVGREHAVARAQLRHVSRDIVNGVLQTLNIRGRHGRPARLSSRRPAGTYETRKHDQYRGDPHPFHKHTSDSAAAITGPLGACLVSGAER